MHLIQPHYLGEHAQLKQVFARLVTGEPIASVLQDEMERGLNKTLLAVVARAHLYTPEEAALGLCQISERMRKPHRQNRLVILQRLLEESIRASDPEKQRMVLSEQKQLLSFKKDIESALRRSDLRRYCELADAEASLKAI